MSQQDGQNQPNSSSDEGELVDRGRQKPKVVSSETLSKVAPRKLGEVKKPLMAGERIVLMAWL